MISPALSRFLSQHQLPEHYLSFADQHFGPLLHWAGATTEPRVLGINGAQGSGKSTLGAWLVAALADRGISALSLSMDDFYLSRAERARLARKVHPLLATRGVPGTHQVARAIEVLDALKSGSSIHLPRFNKATDDCETEILTEPVQIIVLEGWCLGARPETPSTLTRPINALEQTEDPEGVWRCWVNEQLANHYQAWFERVDCWLMLRAPSFECVADWRWQQEQKLWNKHKLAGDLQESQTQDRSAPQGLMTRAQVQRFVQFYERLTKHMLREMPNRVEHLYQLDDKRNITHEQHRQCS